MRPPVASLLSPDDLAAIKSALMDLRDTFFKRPFTLVHRSTALGPYGESAVHDSTSNFDFVGLTEFTRAKGEKYHTVDEDPTGEQQRDGWRFYIWKDDVDAVVVVDPETDKVLLDGVEYIIKFWAESALFSDLGYVFYEMEISKDTAILG